MLNNIMKKISTPQDFKKAKKEVNEARRREMKRLKDEEGWTQKQIADFFDLDESTVSKILKGER